MKKSTLIINSGALSYWRKRQGFFFFIVILEFRSPNWVTILKSSVTAALFPTYKPLLTSIQANPVHFLPLCPTWLRKQTCSLPPTLCGCTSLYHFQGLRGTWWWGRSGPGLCIRENTMLIDRCFGPQIWKPAPHLLTAYCKTNLHLG